MAKIHHRIVTVLKSPLVAFGILPKPKTKPVITVPAAKSAISAAHFWEDHVYAPRCTEPTPPPSRLILSETDEVAIPYIPYTPECPAKTIGDRADLPYVAYPVQKAKKSRSRKSAISAAAKEKAFSDYLDDAGYPKAVKKAAIKPATRAKAKARTKTKSRTKTKTVRHNVDKSWLE